MIVKQFWLKIVVGALIICVLGPLSITMQGYVPITLQSLAVVLVPMVFGWRAGLISIVLYLILGAAGLPIFADFSGGIEHFSGKTVGFLFGFLPAGFLAGWLTERTRVQYARYFFIFIAAQILLLICGSIGLLAHDIEMKTIWQTILLLFPGLMIKAFIGGIIVLAVKIKTESSIE